MSQPVAHPSGDLSALLRAAHPRFSAAQQHSGWQELKRRALRREQSLRRFHWLSFSLATSGIALALGIWIGRNGTSEPMSYVMGGGQVVEDGQLRAGNDLDSLLRFSDGSSFRLGAKTRGRLVSVTANGARVRLADGAADISVTQHETSSWELDAGPYALFLHGATASARWDEAEQLLEVRVRGGSIDIEGPLANDGIVLHSGQLLTIRRAAGEIVVRDARRE